MRASDRLCCRRAVGEEHLYRTMGRSSLDSRQEGPGRGDGERSGRDEVHLDRPQPEWQCPSRCGGGSGDVLGRLVGTTRRAPDPVPPRRLHRARGRRPGAAAAGKAACSRQHDPVTGGVRWVPGGASPWGRVRLPRLGPLEGDSAGRRSPRRPDSQGSCTWPSSQLGPSVTPTTSSRRRSPWSSRPRPQPATARRCCTIRAVTKTSASPSS